MRWLLVAGLVLASCKGEKSATSSPSPDPIPMPQPPASTAEQDALWRLAPNGTRIGFVASSRGVDFLARAVRELETLLHSAPELKEGARELRALLKEQFGTSTLDLETLGMSASRGMAVFYLANGSHILILPVVDRAKFAKAVKATRASDGELALDYICKPIQKVYACAKSGALLAQLGTGPMHEDIRIAGARGDLEIIADAWHLFEEPATIAAVGQLARGSVVIRGGIEGLPSELLERIEPIGTPRIDPTKSVAFGVANFAPLFSDLADVEEPLAPGVTFGALFEALHEPVTLTLAPGAKSGELRIPLLDAELAQQLVERCGQIEALADFGAREHEGGCQLTVPDFWMNVDAWVEGSAIHVGKKGAPTSATVPATPIATELAGGQWAFAVYGRGSLFGDQVLPILPGLTQNRVKLATRVTLLMNELGVGVRTNGHLLQFFAAARTAWSNPDEVVAQLAGLTTSDVLERKAPPVAAQIAKAFPSSPFATDLEGGIYGWFVPAMTIAVVGMGIQEALTEGADEEEPAE